MIFEQFYLGCLAHASYLIGSDGEALIIDPQRDVELYLDAARRHGLAIRHIVETHLHADFVSGHRELAERTGAKIYLGASSGATFPHVPVHDGDSVHCGPLTFEFLETPGHTIESICILLTDPGQSSGPCAVFTGDTLFVGDVGRPDLAPGLTPPELASMLYDSLHGKLLGLPDSVKVYPAHGAGSLCGKQLSTDSFSTIGREKLTNYAVRAPSREEFIHLLTAEMPPRPEYFVHDVEMNRHGARSLENLPLLEALSPEIVRQLQRDGTIVLDTRPVMQYAVAHIPGSVHVALGGQYASWAARILGLDARLVLVGEDEARTHESRMRLARVGIEGVIGFLDGGITRWILGGHPVEYTPQVSVEELKEWVRDRSGSLTLLDVREPAERTSAGFIDGSVSIPLGTLATRLDSLDTSRWVFVHCKGGYRSSVATSLLRRAGFPNVVNITGGFDAWVAARKQEHG
jgi:hydroxyacylglutathione hydrolase